MAMDEGNGDISESDLRLLLETAACNTYKSREGDIQSEIFLQHCLKLVSRDYSYQLIANHAGELCSHYPSKIILLEYMLSDTGRHLKVESLYDKKHIHELFKKAKFARCRARFACPVILIEGKHVCRGATISGGVELYGRSSYDFFFSCGENSSPEVDPSDMQLFDRIRGHDIKLLKTFDVGIICDLMVEKKKVKYGMNVTSSEKVDKENRYGEFGILSLPYPGCEFFKLWRDNAYMAEGLCFDWSQGFVDAKLDISLRLSPPAQIDWTRYRSWDLVALTQNYLILLLHYISTGDSGILIHCISGWDRTPLFVSLLRLSLWADGLIHINLSPIEILYFTIAYDWYLFGHNFTDRLAKGEDIFFFCFTFLKYITEEKFRLPRKRHQGMRSGIARIDSDVDCVLLESLNRSRPGSNSSLNSMSSLNSTRSSIDVSHLAHGDDISTLSGRGDARNQANSTSPMTVPDRVRLQSEFRSSSPGVGSWQVVSGCGSFRGSLSSHESDPSASALNGEQRETSRKAKLDAVRRTFLNVFTSIEKMRPPVDATNSLSGLFDHFAEKVGIRNSSRSTVA